MNRHRHEMIDQRLVRALAHPLRIRILEILTERVASPNRLSADLEADLSHVAYHTRALDRCGCLELVKTTQKRGATEHFYKAAPRSFMGDPSWRKVPRGLRGAVTAASLQTFIDKTVAALEAGTIDDRDDSTFSWMPVHLDERGWEEVAALMSDVTDRVVAIQDASSARTRTDRKDPTLSAIVAFANFETGASRAGG